MKSGKELYIEYAKLKAKSKEEAKKYLESLSKEDRDKLLNYSLHIVDEVLQMLRGKSNGN